MQRWALVVALTLGGLVAPGRAGPSSPENFEELIAEVERLVEQVDPSDPEVARRAQLLGKLQKTIDKKSISLATDADLAAKLVKIVQKAGEDLSDLRDDVAHVVVLIGEEVERMVENLEGRLEGLPESKQRTKAEKKLAQIRGLLSGVSPDDPVAAAGIYRQVVLLRRSAAKLVQKAEAAAGSG